MELLKKCLTCLETLTVGIFCLSVLFVRLFVLVVGSLGGSEERSVS